MTHAELLESIRALQNFVDDLKARFQPTRSMILRRDLISAGKTASECIPHVRKLVLKGIISPAIGADMERLFLRFSTVLQIRDPAPLR
jgi:hypothetical protein